MPTISNNAPKNWPSGVPFLTHPVYSPTLTPSHLATLRLRPQDTSEVPPNTPRGACNLVRVTRITSPSHPANGQSGLFATKDLKPGTFILQYLGEIHATPRAELQTDRHDPHAESNYDLSLDREAGIGIDADRMGSEARFINDYRGVAEKPNAEFRETWDVGRRERGMGVWVLPEGKAGKGKGVKKGEEILVSYGRGFWGARNEA
ncbi:hypothetical protein PZA11_006050 [Diplocarpon coronariae]|uniref:SET domain-containing protein n=1 Tax=Diplocarpon coronariae TaxID=2795749 RepID=A0A218YUR2_9HELO|nr:hypothetical protein B2J93_8164 [Marssonina coronariae]